jgi:hypothetical protein
MVMEMVISSKVLKAQFDEMQKREDERNSSFKIHQLIGGLSKRMF